MDELDKLILKQWTGWVILKRNTPVGISIDGNKITRTGFIEVFKTKKLANMYLQEGERIMKVMVREEIK